MPTVVVWSGLLHEYTRFGVDADIPRPRLSDHYEKIL
jgi:hypothetical protein